jgi:hypothetical protein
MIPPLRILITSSAEEVSREMVPGHLWLTVGIERNGAAEPLTSAEVDKLGLDDDALFSIAMSKLRQTTARADLRPVDTLPGLYFQVAPDGLAASRMVLVPDLMGPEPYGGLVVAVPSQDQLLCVPLRSARALDALQVLASALGHALNAAHEVLSDQLYWYDGKRWIPITVVHGSEEVTVLPPPAFVRTMNRLAAMDLVQVAGEA